MWTNATTNEGEIVFIGRLARRLASLRLTTTTTATATTAATAISLTIVDDKVLSFALALYVIAIFRLVHDLVHVGIGRIVLEQAHVVEGRSTTAACRF